MSETLKVSGCESSGNRRVGKKDCGKSELISSPVRVQRAQWYCALYQHSGIDRGIAQKWEEWFTISCNSFAF